MKKRTLVAVSTLAIALTVLVVTNGRISPLSAQSEATTGARAALELIPEGAMGAVALDIGSLPTLLPLLPAEMLTGSDSIVATSLDAVIVARFGVSVRSVQTLAFFLGSDGESWGLVGMGPVTGEVFLPSATVVSEQTIYSHEPEEGSAGSPLYFAHTSDWFVGGQITTVTAVVEVAASNVRSYGARPILDELFEGGDPALSAVAVFSREGAEAVLRMTGWSFAGEVRALSLAVGPYRSRWSIAFESETQASEAGDAVGDLLSGANEALRELETASAEERGFFQQLSSQLLHTLASSILTERTRYTRTNNVVHLEVLGPPSLTLTSLTTLRMALRHQAAAANPQGSSSEATQNLERLFVGASLYHDTVQRTASGDVIPVQFPDSAPLTPDHVPCGSARMSNADDWQLPTWQALNFEITDPHYYSYQFDSTGIGTAVSFTASAFGDLDCDGVYSTFVRTGTIRDWMVFGEEHSFEESE